MTALFLRIQCQMKVTKHTCVPVTCAELISTAISVTSVLPGARAGNGGVRVPASITALWVCRGRNEPANRNPRLSDVTFTTC